MASNFEKGGKPGIEVRPERQPKQQNDPKDVRRALGNVAVRGAQQGKK